MCFDKLRKRYNKKKNDAKKLKSQVRQLERVKRQRRHLKLTSFFSGCTSLFISGKVVRTFQEITALAMTMKMKMMDMPVTSISLTKIKVMTRKKKTTLKTVELLPSYHLLIVEPDPLHHLHCCQRKIQHLPKERQTPQIKQPTKKKGKGPKNEYLDEMELNVIRDIAKTIKDDPKELDGIDIYVRSLAADLPKLLERDYFMVKHEIQGVLFKYQMARFGQNQGGSIVGGSSANTETNFMINNNGF